MSTCPILLLLAVLVSQAADVPNFIKEYSKIGNSY
jgi:hypothetical protein